MDLCALFIPLWRLSRVVLWQINYRRIAKFKRYAVSQIFNIYIYPHFLSIFLFDLFSTEHGCNVKTKCVLETNSRQFWQPLKKWLEGLYYHFTSQTVLFKWLHVTWTSLNICNFLLTIPEFEIEKFKCFRTS